MIITAIETTRLTKLANLLWVEIHTDEGLIGLGETFRGAEAVESYIHSIAAPMLLGRDPSQIEAISKQLLRGYLGFNGSGVETRAASAIDIALWDIFGQATGLPIHTLLGGLCHSKMRTYNTCASNGFNTSSESRRVITKGENANIGAMDDQVAFIECADELALSLLEDGFTAMKIWPHDNYATASGGQMITAADIKKGLEPYEKIRKAVGDRIEVMSEMHSLWNAPAALAIARELREYKPFWVEDPIKMDGIQMLADFRRLSGVPVCGSETLATRSSFRDILMADAVDYVMLDLSWCGGISEARKIGTMAEAFQKPIAPHDCTGPVVLMASLQLGLASPNAIFQEVVRAYLNGFYRELVEGLPVLEKGYLLPPTAPGLGMTLSEQLRKREDRVTRISKR